MNPFPLKEEKTMHQEGMHLCKHMLTPSLSGEAVNRDGACPRAQVSMGDDFRSAASKS